MANHRLPASKAAVAGAAIKNPQRFKDRKAPKGTRALGEPYMRMTDDQKVAWEMFRGELPWLNSSHRALLQIACILRVRMDDADVGVNQIQTYSAVLSKLAATPVDETKVGSSDDDDVDEDAEFYSN